MITRRAVPRAAAPCTARSTQWITARRMTWLVVAALLFGAALPSRAASADPSRADRGRALYEANCQYCHTENIHRRPNKLPMTRDELRGIVDHFRRTANQAWTPEEIEDVVDYLNRTHYRLGR